MSHWENLNPALLPKYQAVVFLDTRHEDAPHRAALPDSLMHAWGRIPRSVARSSFAAIQMRLAGAMVAGRPKSDAI